MTVLNGSILKLKSRLADPIEYTLPIGDSELPLNPLLGKTLALHFSGKLLCIACGNKSKSSFMQGYCYPCSQRLARCDICMVRPEKCHFRLGTCREPEWAQQHCFIPHIVYLANSSGLKVGITRETQIPTRWIDQGAVQALPILRVQNRYHSGLAEILLKTHVNDKTNWRKMLQGPGEEIDLIAERNALLEKCTIEPTVGELITDAQVLTFTYPILQYPIKITSLNTEKTPQITGTLLGIKGQYLIFDCGVLNVRNLAGQDVSVMLESQAILA